VSRKSPKNVWGAKTRRALEKSVICSRTLILAPHRAYRLFEPPRSIGALAASTLAEDALGSRSRVGCRHFATASWRLSRGTPGLLVAAGLEGLFSLIEIVRVVAWRTAGRP
jgi:hypothetical protein